MEKKETSSVMMAVVISLMLIISHLVIYFTGLWREMWAAYLSFGLFFIAIIVVVIIHSREKKTTPTFGNLFGFGFKTVAAVTSLMILYTILFNVLMPEAKEQYLVFLREQTLKNPNATEEMADKTVEMFGNNFMLLSVLGTLFWYLILGCIASLIGAAAGDKKPRIAEFENI